jgi:hypothetical protein
MVTHLIRQNGVVVDDPVEFKKWPVQVQHYRRITNHFRGIYIIWLRLRKEKSSKDVNM